MLSLRPMTAMASIRMLVARVITIAVSTKACGRGSATVTVLVPSVMGSVR